MELEAPLKKTAAMDPIKPTPAVRICPLVASHRVNPDRNRMAKSPTSWGISCTNIAKVVKHPNLYDTKKAPPIERPCVKLSMAFAIRFRYPVIYKLEITKH